MSQIKDQVYESPGYDKQGNILRLQRQGTPVYHYFLKDHLGNVRVVMNQDGETVEQSTSYYPFGGIFAGTGDGEQPIKFGGKEFDPMHGLNWSDFVARMKGNWRFMSIDPLCEKYYSVSPYAYCANNPINAFDLNGDSIWYTTDKYVVTMHVTGKVINNSSDNINIKRASSDIASGISNAFSGEFEYNGQTYMLQTDIQLEAVNSMNNVKASDHLFVFEDADGESARGATSMPGGKVMTLAASDYANNNWFSNTFFSNNTRTALHEFGHAVGLPHINAGTGNNLMTPGKNGTKVTFRQRQIMINSSGTINKGSNSYMGHPYPYVHDFETGGVYLASRLLNWKTLYKNK